MSKNKNTLKEIDKYENLIFNEQTIPKPKNWARKTFNCTCNIPVVEADGTTYNTEKILERIDIKYIVKNKEEENVMMGGHNKTKWWFHAKPNFWKITHLEISDFKDIKHYIYIGYIERGGALTPTPLFIVVEDIQKYKNLMLVRKRKAKLLNLQKNGTL